MKRLSRPWPGLPAAANVEQAIILAQLQILRKLERERAGFATAPFLFYLLVLIPIIGLGWIAAAKVIWALKHLI